MCISTSNHRLVALLHGDFGQGYFGTVSGLLTIPAAHGAGVSVVLADENKGYKSRPVG